MERKTFDTLIKCILPVVLMFGIYFTLTYFKYVFIKDISAVKTIALWLIELSWILLVLILFKKRKQIYERRKELLVLVSVLLIAIIMLEISLRIIGAAPPIYSPHPYLNYYGTPNYRSVDGLNMHNSLGYRGPEIITPKPKEMIRIIITGGSTTYETGIKDWRKDSARQLQKELRNYYNADKIEVINAGFGGWDSWEGLIDLELRVLELQPDLIMLYHGVNDAHSRLVNPKYYKADNTGRRKQWERKPCVSIFCLRAVQLISGLTKSDFDVDASTWGPDNPKILGISPMEALQMNKPVYFERNMQNMITLAQEKKVSLMLITWAHTNQHDDYAILPHYEKAFEEHNEIIKALGKKNKVPVYDYVAEMPRDKKYWVDGRHVNEEGARVKGELLARFIIKNKLINL